LTAERESVYCDLWFIVICGDVLPNFSIHEEEDKKNTQTHEKKFKNKKAEFF